MKELFRKKVVKRTIDVTRPLRRSDSQLVRNGSNWWNRNSPYKLPTANVNVNPIFKRVEVCRFHTIRIGRISMMTSVTMFGMLSQTNNASLLIHLAPGTSGFQLAAKGIH